MADLHGPPPPWWRRKGPACTLIALAAVAVIATTAAISTFVGKDSAASQTDEPAALGVQHALLYPKDVNALFGIDDLEFKSSFGKLGADGAKVEPPECAAVNYPASAQAWSGVDWQAMSGLDLQTSGDDFRWVREAVFGVSSAEEAQSVLANAAQRWSACNGKPYSVTTDEKTRHWFMQDFRRTADTVTAVIAQEGSEYRCQLVRTVMSKYVVDAQACAYDISDQGEKLAAAVADRLKSEVGL